MVVVVVAVVVAVAVAVAVVAWVAMVQKAPEAERVMRSRDARLGDAMRHGAMRRGCVEEVLSAG